MEKYMQFFMVLISLIAVAVSVVALVYSYHARMRVNDKIKTVQKAVNDVKGLIKLVEIKAEQFSTAVTNLNDELKELHTLADEELNIVKRREIII